MHRSARPLDLATAGAVSLAAHAAAAFLVVGLFHLAQLRLFGGGAAVDAQARGPFPSDTIEVEIELPQLPEKSALLGLERAEPSAQEVALGGPTVARLDQGRAGRGGDGKVHEQALNFAEQDDRITRDPSVMSSLAASQVPRVQAGKERKARENYRASRDPMELTFVAMGKQHLARERRPEAERVASLGLAKGEQRHDQGAALGRAPAPAGEGLKPLETGSDKVGTIRRTLGVGIQGGSIAVAESPAIRNAHARPLVDAGSPSVPAVAEGRPSDTVDSEQAVASRMQSLMHASTLGGAKGAGRGGEGGGGAPGAGGHKGPTQTAAKIGAGGAGPGDVERMGYIRAIQSKVHPLWQNAFPAWAIAEGRGGTAVIAFTVEPDGTIHSVRVARPSSIPEFDENVRKAVLKAAPFGPLPSALKPRLSLTLSFAAVNPAVRPKDPKNGPVD